MVGISGMDDFMKGLNDYVDNIGKLDGLSVSIDPVADTVGKVEQKLRVELRRRGATGFSASEVRGMAEDLLRKARE